MTCKYSILFTWLLACLSGATCAGFYGPGARGLGEYLCTLELPKGCSSCRQSEPGCSVLFLSTVQAPSHSTWLSSGEEPLALRTWRPCAGSAVALCSSAHLLSRFSGSVLSADCGWVFDSLFGETEEMSKYVKTFAWPLPERSKKLQKVPQHLVKCSLQVRRMSGFSPPGRFFTLWNILGGNHRHLENFSLQGRHQRKPPSNLPR